MDKEHKYWFKRKRYGWGWTPVDARGIVLLITYFVVIFGAAWVLLEDVPRNTYQAEVGYFFVIIALMTLILYFIAAKTGPQPKFRWGKGRADNSDEDY